METRAFKLCNDMACNHFHLQYDLHGLQAVAILLDEGLHFVKRLLRCDVTPSTYQVVNNGPTQREPPSQLAEAALGKYYSVYHGAPWFMLVNLSIP